MIVKGNKYSDLRKSFIIFVCTFDPFDKKRYLYTFKEICIEDQTLLLGDETSKIFLNTKGKIGNVSELVKEFLGYVENSTDEFAERSNSELVKIIHKKVIAVKQSKEMEMEYMTLLLRDQDMREEGSHETMRILKYYSAGYSITEIANRLNIEKYIVEEKIRSYESID